MYQTFAIAEITGKSAAEVLEMSEWEFDMWPSYLKAKSVLQEEAQKEAERKRKK